jgi:hypothetical protein
MASLAGGDVDEVLDAVEVPGSTFTEDWVTILRDTQDDAERRHADAYLLFGDRRIWFHKAIMSAYIPSLHEHLEALDGLNATKVGVAFERCFTGHRHPMRWRAHVLFVGVFLHGAACSSTLLPVHACVCVLFCVTLLFLPSLRSHRPLALLASDHQL